MSLKSVCRKVSERSFYLLITARCRGVTNLTNDKLRAQSFQIEPEDRR